METFDEKFETTYDAFVTASNHFEQELAPGQQDAFADMVDCLHEIILLLKDKE